MTLLHYFDWYFRARGKLPFVSIIIHLVQEARGKHVLQIPAEGRTVLERIGNITLERNIYYLLILKSSVIGTYQKVSNRFNIVMGILIRQMIWCSSIDATVPLCLIATFLFILRTISVNFYFR